MGVALVSDGGCRIVVGKLGNRSNAARSQILKRQFGNQPHRFRAEITTFDPAGKAIIEIITETVGVIAINGIRKDYETRHIVLAYGNGERILVIGDDRQAIGTILQFVDNIEITLLMDVHLHGENGLALAQRERSDRQHAGSTCNRNIIDAQRTIIRDIGDKGGGKITRTLEIQGVGGLHLGTPIVIGLDGCIHCIISTLDNTSLSRIRSQCNVRPGHVVKREVEYRVVEQAVTDSVRESVTVRVVLDHLHAHAVFASLATLAAQVNEQGVVVKPLQKVRAVLGHRYTAVVPASQRMVVVRHREAAVVADLADRAVDTVSALLQQLVVDVHRNSVLGILVAPGMHLHTNVVVTVRSQVGHVRNKLATRQNRILHVENRSVVGEPRYNLNTRIPRGCADIAGIGLRRVVVLPEHIYDAVEASLLEQDVHLRAGVKGTQTDKVAPAILLNLHRERASPSVKSVVLRNLRTVGRVKLRNHVHEAVVVERQTHIAPVHAIRGVLYHILQIHI